MMRRTPSSLLLVIAVAGCVVVPPDVLKQLAASTVQTATGSAEISTGNGLSDPGVKENGSLDAASSLEPGNLSQVQPVTATDPGKLGTGADLNGSTPHGRISGTVLGEGGLPASGVRVTAFLVNTSPLIGNAGVGLVGNAGAGLIGNAGSGLATSPAVRYATTHRFWAQAIGTVETNEGGQFFLAPSATGTINLEAVRSDTSKAWKASLTYSALPSSPISAGTLQLAPTGTLTGKVSAPEAPTVKNFQGVDVYIPGSSYVAKADAAGSYTIQNVAAGIFDLAAEKQGLGKAFRTGVEVLSKQLTTAPDLALSLKVPEIVEAIPPNAGPGVRIAVKGKNFGATTGEPVHVTFNAIDATDVQRLDDENLTATIPKTATTGNVLVRVGDINSNPFPYQILKDLRLTPKIADLLVGNQLIFAIDPIDTSDNPVISPIVEWSLTGNAATITATATRSVVFGKALGDALVSVGSGLTASVVKVHVFQVFGVTLQPQTATLSAMPTAGTPDADFQTQITLKGTVNASDGQDRAISWSTSNSGLVTVQDGIVRAAATTSGGKATVTAASKDDPTKLATASITVTTSGNLLLEVN